MEKPAAPRDVVCCTTLYSNTAVARIRTQNKIVFAVEFN